MKTNNIYILLSTALTIALASCSSDSDLPLTQPDEENPQGIVCFSIDNMEQTSPAPTATAGARYATRADSHSHRKYNSSMDPKTMGVFGYNAASEPTLFFNNTKNTFSNGVYFDYDPLKNWSTMTGDNYFFGYMVYRKSGVSMEVESGKYSLKFPDAKAFFPVTAFVERGVDDQNVADSRILVCHDPIKRTDQTDKSVIKFQMDQTVAKFYVQIKLDEKMTNVRNWKVTKVEVKYRPTITDLSFDYTLSSTTWTRTMVASTPSGDADSLQVFPSTLTEAQITAAGAGKTAENYSYAEESSTADIASYIGTLPEEGDDNYRKGNLTSTYKRFGDPFYLVPVVSEGKIVNNPTISLTYEVYDDNKCLIRTETKSLTLSSDVFNNFTPANVKAGDRFLININIAPWYLYTLSDADKNEGVILVE